jgi:hypothetical protein
LILCIILLAPISLTPILIFIIYSCLLILGLAYSYLLRSLRFLFT